MEIQRKYGDCRNPEAATWLAASFETTTFRNQQMSRAKVFVPVPPAKHQHTNCIQYVLYNLYNILFLQLVYKKTTWFHKKQNILWWNSFRRILEAKKKFFFPGCAQCLLCIALWENSVRQLCKYISICHICYILKSCLESACSLELGHSQVLPSVILLG